MKVLFFGTYDSERHPRIGVLREGFAAAGDEVYECNVPLGLDTAERVRIMQRPWLTPKLVGRLAVAWVKLWLRSRRLPRMDALVIGYMGHFDILFARLLWRRVPIVLDHLIFASDTAEDRGVSAKLILRLLRWLDRVALQLADIICVDTTEHKEMVPGQLKSRVIVIPVGVSSHWMMTAPRPSPNSDLRVIFFGLYSPVQGATVIARAIRILAERGRAIRFTMVGKGQELETAKRIVGDAPNVSWVDWVDYGELPSIVAAHDVCLGIFGDNPKSHRVVPNKVFQGAAANCAIVTSRTRPQLEAFRDAALFVPPDDSGALAACLERLRDDSDLLMDLKKAARMRVRDEFRPVALVAPIRARLSG
jgi:glycosyltransferase involved in cell wall biosynthesis